MPIVYPLFYEGAEGAGTKEQGRSRDRHNKFVKNVT